MLVLNLSDINILSFKLTKLYNTNLQINLVFKISNENKIEPFSIKYKIKILIKYKICAVLITSLLD